MPSRRAATIASFAAALALILLVALVVEPLLATVPHQPQADEGFYLAYTQAVADRGLSTFSELFRNWLGNERNWIYPPPSRVAFVATAALWSKAFGATLDSLSRMSLASHLCTIAVVFVFARRHLGNLRGLAVAALTAWSTLYLGLSRLALTDSFISLWQVVTLCLFYEAVREPQRWLWRVPFVAAFAFAILSKEISVLLALPCAGFVLIERFVRGRSLALWKLAALLVVPIVLSVVVWIAAAGSATLLYRTLDVVLSSPATNKYALQFGSGPWYRYVMDEVLASPWPTALGLIGLAVVVWRWRNGDYDQLGAFMAIVYVTQIAVLSFFTKNLRYVAVLDVPLRVLAVALLWQLLAAERRRMGQLACAALVALMCWADHAGFQRVFVAAVTFDPVSSQLLWTRELVPPPQGAPFDWRK